LCGEEEEETSSTSVIKQRKLTGERNDATGGKTPAGALSKEILSVLDQLSDTSLNESESLREILDRTLAKVCLQTAQGGWWVYEYCHKEQIRQFHEVTAMRKGSSANALPSRIVESEHILGRYNVAAIASEEIGDDEEWKLVVNATEDGKVFGDGNGAYYEIEYTGGDVCDHEDVTGSAIVAGSTGTNGGIVERASTVRFYCGNEFGIQVNEDHTCHYVVQLKVPGLCGHPLFRAPILKKQIMKCLPVEN